jgi:hypothetical protein
VSEERVRFGLPRTPRLAALIESGTVQVTVFGYEGVASDGVHVSLGYVGDEVAVEAYLVTHPSPKEW